MRIVIFDHGGDVIAEIEVAGTRADGSGRQHNGTLLRECFSSTLSALLAEYAELVSAQAFPLAEEVRQRIAELGLTCAEAPGEPTSRIWDLQVYAEGGVTVGVE